MDFLKSRKDLSKYINKPYEGRVYRTKRTKKSYAHFIIPVVMVLTVTIILMYLGSN